MSWYIFSFAIYKKLNGLKSYFHRKKNGNVFLGAFIWNHPQAKTLLLYILERKMPKKNHIFLDPVLY